jgi:hypothetical protein
VPHFLFSERAQLLQEGPCKVCSNVFVEGQHVQAAVEVQVTGCCLALVFKHELSWSSVGGNAEQHACGGKEECSKQVHLGVWRDEAVLDHNNMCFAIVSAHG